MRGVARALWWLCLVDACTTGCSNDFDALYRGEGLPDGATPSRLELPARPDSKFEHACNECAASRCEQERANCLRDEKCIAELDCREACDNPSCLLQCGAVPASPWYADYFNCVFGQCGVDCNHGANWECAGEYAWPAAKEDSFDVRFRFMAPATIFLGGQTAIAVTGRRVRACPDVPGCPSPFDSDEVARDFSATLSVRPSEFPPRDFRGYLEFADLAGQQAIIYSAPLARSLEYFAGSVGSALGPASMDVARPRLTAVVLDCLSTPVPGAVVTLPEHPEIPAFAIDNRLQFSEGPTTATGLATVVNLPDDFPEGEGSVLVRAERPDGTLISEREFHVRPGFSTQVHLGPAAR